MAVSLTREDIIDGLSELAGRAHEAGIQGVHIEIVGGAALRLAYFDRATTVDIDARITPEERLAPIIAAIAEERRWPGDWINSNAAQFIPEWGRLVQWRVIRADDQFTISVAPPEVLLAMKLHAVQWRGNRDIADVAKLMALLGVASPDEAESIYGEFFPGDEFTPRTYERVQRVFDVGLPDVERPPSPPFELDR